jgi:hypothetical protein
MSSVELRIPYQRWIKMGKILSRLTLRKIPTDRLLLAVASFFGGRAAIACMQ